MNNNHGSQPGATPRRRHPATRPLDDLGNRSNIVFCTVCVEGRRPLLANDEAHALILQAWRDADQWRVGRYVLMPDHVHLFCAPATPEAPNVRRWIAYWKFLASRAWPTPVEKPIWQRDAWDRQLRQGESYDRKWEYVRQNPVRAGLAPSADAWPYQGEICVFQWHDQ